MGGGKGEQGRVEEFQGGEEQRVEKKRGQEAFGDGQCIDSSSANEEAEKETKAAKDRQHPKETGASRKVVDRCDHNELEVISKEDKRTGGSKDVEDDDTEESRGGRGEKIWDGREENDHGESDHGLEGTSNEETEKDEDVIEGRGLDGSERGLKLTGNSSPRDVKELGAWNSDAREAESGWRKDKDPRGGETKEHGDDEDANEGDLESGNAADDELGSEKSEDGRLDKKAGAGPAIDTAVGLSQCHVRKQHSAFDSETRGDERGKEQGDETCDDVQDELGVKRQTRDEASDGYKSNHDLGGSADKNVEDENNVSLDRGNHEETVDPTDGIDIVGEPLRSDENRTATIRTGQMGMDVQIEDDQGEEEESEEEEDKGENYEDNGARGGSNTNSSKGDREGGIDAEGIGDREVTEKLHDAERLCKSEEDDGRGYEIDNDYDEEPLRDCQNTRPAPTVPNDRLGSPMTPHGEFHAEERKASGNGSGASEVTQLDGRDFNLQRSRIVEGDPECEEKLLGDVECGFVRCGIGQMTFGSNLIHQHFGNDEKKQCAKIPSNVRNPEGGCPSVRRTGFDEATSAPPVMDAGLRGEGTRNEYGSETNCSKEDYSIVSTGCAVLTNGLQLSSVCTPLKIEKDPRVPVENEGGNRQEIEPRVDDSADMDGDDPSGQDVISSTATEVGPPTAASGSGEGLSCSDAVPISRLDATASAIRQLEKTHEEPCRLNLDAPADSVVKAQVNEESCNLVEQSLHSSSNEPCHNATASSSADRPLQTWSTAASDGDSIVRGLCLGAESDDGTVVNAQVIATPELDSAIERVGNGAGKCAQAPSHPVIPDVSTIHAVSVSRESRGLEKQMVGDSKEDIEESEEINSRGVENREVELSSPRCASDKSHSLLIDVPALAFPEAVVRETSENEGNENALSRIGKTDGAVKPSPESEAERSSRQEFPFDCPESAESPPQQIDSMRASPEDESRANRQKGVESISVTDLSTPAAVLCKENRDPHNQSDQSEHSRSGGDPASGNASASNHAVSHTTPVDNNGGLITSGRAVGSDEWSAIVTRSSTGNAQLCDNGPAFQVKVDLNESRARGKEVIVRTATCFIGDQTAAENNAWAIQEGDYEEDPLTRTFAGDGPSANDRTCQTSWNKEVGTQTMPL